MRRSNRERLLGFLAATALMLLGFLAVVLVAVFLGGWPAIGAWAASGTGALFLLLFYKGRPWGFLDGGALVAGGPLSLMLISSTAWGMPDYK